MCVYLSFMYEREFNWPWCMKPLLQRPTPSVTASSRVEQSPWETKSMTHTVGQLQCLFTPSHTQQTEAPLAWVICVFVGGKMVICESAVVINKYVCNKKQWEIGRLIIHVLGCVLQGQWMDWIVTNVQNILSKIMWKPHSLFLPCAYKPIGNLITSV